MAQENNYEAPRRLNEYHYDAAGDCMQAVDEENPYENTQFPDVHVEQDLQAGAQHPPPPQPNNKLVKPKPKLSKLQIAIICALVLNFALAACGIILLMLEKNKVDAENESTKLDFQMQKQTNGETDETIAEMNDKIKDIQIQKQTNRREVNAKFAELEVQINGSVNILENSIREHKRLSNDREIRHNLTHQEMLNVSKNLIEDRLRDYERISDDRESRHNLTHTKHLADLAELNEALQNKLEQTDGELQLLKDILEGLVIRLVGGSTYYGRVEVYYKGVWGTVCDDSWGVSDAKVVCKMLGFQRATSAPGSAHYGQGTGQIWLDEVRCTGSESNIWDCSKNSWGSHDCTHGEDASAQCA